MIQHILAYGSGWSDLVLHTTCNGVVLLTALLMKVLLDPAVDQSLRENISHKRQEALTKCSEMEALIHHKQRFAVHTLSLFLKSTLLLTHKHKDLYTTRVSKSYTVQGKGRVIVGP